MKYFTYLFLFLLPGYLIGSASYELSYEQGEQESIILHFDLQKYNIGTEVIGGTSYQTIDFGSGVQMEKKGYAALPYVSKAIQLPANKNVELNILNLQYEDIALEFPLLPSRGVIYRNQDPTSIPFEIDPGSVTTEWYPGEAAGIATPFVFRDVRGTGITLYPFQYQSATYTLRVYRSIEIELVPSEAQPTNPLTNDSPQILREMEGIYESVFINYESTRDALDYGQYGDILVITTSRDEDVIDSYISWKREKGFKVFKEVVPEGTNVKDLIQQKYDENNSLLYVQLVGDWSEIESDLGTSSNYPMDPQLGCVVGSDYYADIAIGRLSASSAEEVTIQVNKIIQYERDLSPGSGWLSTATGIGSQEGPGDDNERDYEHLDVIYYDKLNPFTYSNYNDIYEPSASKSMVTDAVNTGNGIMNYCGHGSKTSWGTTGFNNSDVNALSNLERQPWIISVACNNGEFHTSGDCFAETWLNKEDGGAVTMLASTISQPWNPPMRGQDYFNDILVGGYDYDAHSGQSGINTSEQRTFTGSIVINGFALMLTESNSSSDVETAQTWTLFGDPALQLRTADPQVLVLSNMDVLVGLPFETTVTADGPVEGAMVTLSQNELFFTGITDPEGRVSIEHSLDPGPALLVVTAFNAETVYENVDVGSSDGPWITMESFTIMDSADGNSNGQADYDETFYLDVDATNIGTEPAYEVEGILSTIDSNLTIIDSVHYYGNIDTNAITPGPQAFLLHVADGVPDQSTAYCTIDFSDSSSGSWSSELSFVINAPVLVSGESALVDTASGDGDAKLDVGETADLYIPAINTGHADAFGLISRISSESEYLTIINDSCLTDTLVTGDTVNSVFTIQASQSASPGESVDIIFSIDDGTYSCLDTFEIIIGDMPIYLMADGSESVENALFYDSGGEDATYQSRERLTMTFYPEEEHTFLEVHFTSFHLGMNDQLHIHDGTDRNAQEVIGSPFSGTSLPANVIATNEEGALTFYFTSNLIDNQDGWSAELFSSVVSDIRINGPETAHRFELNAAYPNPFNPSTTVRYSLAKAGRVSISVYNLLGQQVASLINTFQPEGSHHVQWNGKDGNGNDLSSGLYFVRMQTAHYNATKKVCLIR